MNFSKATNMNELLGMMIPQCNFCKSTQNCKRVVVKDAYKKLIICSKCLAENTDFYEVENEDL